MRQQEIWLRHLRAQRAFFDYSNALIEALRADMAGNSALAGRWLQEFQRLADVHSECHAAVEESGLQPLAHLSEETRVSVEDWWRTHCVMSNVRDFCMNGLRLLAPCVARQDSAGPAGPDRETIENSLEIYRALRERETSKLDALIEEITNATLA